MRKKNMHIGIDFGGTKIEGVVLKSNFEKAEDIDDYVLYRERIDTEAEFGYDHLVKRLSDFIKHIIRKMKLNLESITIGIGLPGSIIRKTGYVKNSNTTCLNNKPFWTDVQKHISLPIIFENDANCFALAEAVWGAGKSYSVIFGVILGTGVGGGIIINKQILSGLQNIAGEWGHALLIPGTRPCYCGKKGCIETYLSGPAFKMYELKENKFLISSHDFCINWDNGKYENNSSAQLAIDQYCKHFGMALSNIINILDPDVIILGGGMSNASFIYTNGLQYVKKYVFNDELLTPIKKAILGDSAGVFGAAYLGAMNI
jgi:fructokinase